MKKLYTLLLTAALLLAFGVPTFAASGNVSTLEASATTTTITVSGTTDSNIPAVMVEVLSGSESLAYYSFEVSSSKTFSGSISGLSLTDGSKYTVRAADYDGGSWTTAEVTAKAAASGGNTGGSTYVPSTTKKDTTTETKKDTTETKAETPAATTEKPAASTEKTPEATPVAPTNQPSDEPAAIANETVTEEVKLDANSEEAWDEVAEAVDNAFAESLASAGLSEEEIEAIMESGELGSDVLENPIEVVVEMGECTELDASILEKIQGKNVDLVLDMGNGIKWTINGTNVTGTNLANINLEVTVGDTSIPEDQVNALAGDNPVINISLTHDGEFGFGATLTIDLGAEYAGQYANLYYFNPEKGYEFMGSYPVKEDGSSDLEFTHASEYSLILTAMPLSETIQAAGGEEGGLGAEVGATASSASNAPIRIIVIAVIAVIVVVGAVFVIRKKAE